MSLVISSTFNNTRLYHRWQAWGQPIKPLFSNLILAARQTIEVPLGRRICIMILGIGVQRRSKRWIPRGDWGTDGISWSHTITPLQVSCIVNESRCLFALALCCSDVVCCLVVRRFVLLPLVLTIFLVQFCSSPFWTLLFALISMFIPMLMFLFLLHLALLLMKSLLLYLVLEQRFQFLEISLTHTSIGLLDDLVQDEELDLNFLMSQATMFLLCVTYEDIRIHLYWPGSDHHINPTLPPCEWHLALEGFPGGLWRRILECGVRIRIR